MTTPTATPALSHEPGPAQDGAAATESAAPRRSPGWRLAGRLDRVCGEPATRARRGSASVPSWSLRLTMLTWPVTSGDAVWPAWTIRGRSGPEPGARPGGSCSVGRQVVFTYGPLGLVTEPRAVTGGTLILGLLGAAAMQTRARRRRAARAAPPVSLGDRRADRVALGSHHRVGPLVGLPPLDEIASPRSRSRLRSLRPGHDRPPVRSRSPVERSPGSLCCEVQRRHRRRGDRAVGLCWRRRSSAPLGNRALTFRADDNDRLACAWPATRGAFPDYVSHRVSIVEGYVDADGLHTSSALPGHMELLRSHSLGCRLAAAAWSSSRRRAATPPRSRLPLRCGCRGTTSVRGAEMFVRYDRGHGRGVVRCWSRFR